MIEKFGKPIKMKDVGRNLNKIKEMIAVSHQQSEQCYCPPKDGDTLQCRICGSKDAELFVSVWGKYHYYQCMKCGAVFLHNLPDVEKMYVGTETVNGGLYINDAVYKQRVEIIAAPKVQFVIDLCKQAGYQISQWLDIGCGGGEILSFCQNIGINAVGIEPDKNECDFAVKKGLNVYNYYMDVERDNPQIDSLIAESNVISALNVLEHIAYPLPFVKYIYEHMKPESFFVFEVPRHPSMASFANQTCSQAVYRHMVSPMHLQIFSEKSLKYLLGDGFNIIGKWEFGQGYTDMINNAMILSDLQESSLYVDLLNLSNKLQPVIDEAGFADVMLVVAQKSNITKKK